MQELRELEYVVGAEDHIHVRIAGPQLLYHSLFLHHAPAQSDDHIPVPALVLLTDPEPAVESLVRILPYRAGIVYQDIGILLG